VDAWGTDGHLSHCSDASFTHCMVVSKLQSVLTMQLNISSLWAVPCPPPLLSPCTRGDLLTVVIHQHSNSKISPVGADDISEGI